MAICPVMSKEGKKEECIRAECAWWWAGGSDISPFADCVVHSVLPMTMNVVAAIRRAEDNVTKGLEAVRLQPMRESQAAHKFDEEISKARDASMQAQLKKKLGG